jgi:hypothetical protein
MCSDKSLWNEWMWSSRIKKNSGKNGLDIERTEHDLWFHFCRLCGHMVHLPSVGWPCVHLLVAILPLEVLLIWLIWTVIRHVPLFPTTETLVWSVGSTILHRSGIRIPWTWCMLTTLLLERGVLLKMLALVSLLHRIMRTLRVWSTIPLTNWPLEPMLKTLLCIRALMCIAPRALSLHPPFSILLLVHIV